MIVKFDGKDIKEMRDLPRIVADTPVGKDVEVIVIRKGKEENEDGHARPARGRREAAAGVGATTGDAATEPTVVKKALGLDLADITDELRKRYKHQGQRSRASSSPASTRIRPPPRSGSAPAT